MIESACGIGGCPNPQRARGWCDKHWKRWRKGGDPAAESRFDRSARLRAMVAEAVLNRKRTGECWVDGDFARRRDYPKIGSVPVGHLVMELDGRPRPPGLQMLHSCDTPRCWHPGHLRWGTQAKNNADMSERGRNRQAKGEKSGRAKLSEAAVREIRARYAAGGILQRKLAAEHGVSKTTIGQIVRRKRWVHLD